MTLYAQIHDDPTNCVCWHLITIQFRWDEVKGMRLIVYEDIFSETSLCTLQYVDLALLRRLCCYFVLLLPVNVWTNYHRLGIPCFALMLTMNWAPNLGFLLDQLHFPVCGICTGVLPRYLMHQDRVQAHNSAIKPF